MSRAATSRFPGAKAFAGFAVALIAAFVLAACGRDQPAASGDLQLLRRALSSPHEYMAAVSELEKNPQAARRALKEQSAPPGTRKQFLLRAIADRVEKPGRYARWDEELRQDVARNARPAPGEELSSLVRGRHVYFWSEKLLFGDAAAGAFAARHLVSIDSDAAHEALLLRITDTSRDADAGFRTAARALAAAGRADALTQALSGWFASSVAGVTTATRAIAQLRAALAALPATKRGPAEQQLLRELESPKLSLAERRARLVVLEGLVRSGSLERLAKLRRSPWGSQLRPELDAALVAALSREPDLARLGEPGERAR